MFSSSLGFNPEKPPLLEAIKHEGKLKRRWRLWDENKGAYLEFPPLESPSKYYLMNKKPINTREAHTALAQAWNIAPEELDPYGSVDNLLTAEQRQARDAEYLKKAQLNQMVPNKPPRYGNSGWEYYIPSSGTYLPIGNSAPEQHYELPKNFLEEFYGKEKFDHAIKKASDETTKKFHQGEINRLKDRGDISPKKAEEMFEPFREMGNTYDDFKLRMAEMGVIPQNPPIKQGSTYQYYSPIKGQYEAGHAHGNIPPSQFYNAPEEYIQKYFAQEAQNPALTEAAQTQQQNVHSQFVNRPQNQPFRLNAPELSASGARRILEQPSASQLQQLFNPLRQARAYVQNILMPASLQPQADAVNPALVAHYAREMMQSEQSHPAPGRRINAYERILRHFNPELYNPEAYPEEE